MVIWEMYSLFCDFVAAAVAYLSENGGNEEAFLNL